MMFFGPKMTILPTNRPHWGPLGGFSGSNFVFLSLPDPPGHHF